MRPSRIAKGSGKTTEFHLDNRDTQVPAADGWDGKRTGRFNEHSRLTMGPDNTSPSAQWPSARGRSIDTTTVMAQECHADLCDRATPPPLRSPALGADKAAKRAPIMHTAFGGRSIIDSCVCKVPGVLTFTSMHSSGCRNTK